MKCKILEINTDDALISLEDGTAFDISVTKLPKNIKQGDFVEIPFSPYSDFQSHSFKKDTLTNNKIIDFF